DDVYVAATGGSATLEHVTLTDLGANLDHDGAGTLDGGGAARKLAITATGAAGDVVLGAAIGVTPAAGHAVVAPVGAEVTATADRDIVYRTPGSASATRLTAGGDVLVETDGALSVGVVTGRDIQLAGSSVASTTLTAS